MTEQTTTTLQEEIAAAQRRIKPATGCERRRLVGYIQALNTALYVISQQRETAVEMPY